MVHTNESHYEYSGHEISLEQRKEVFLLDYVASIITYSDPKKKYSVSNSTVCVTQETSCQILREEAFLCLALQAMNLLTCSRLIIIFRFELLCDATKRKEIRDITHTHTQNSAGHSET